MTREEISLLVNEALQSPVTQFEGRLAALERRLGDAEGTILRIDGEVHGVTCEVERLVDDAPPLPKPGPPAAAEWTCPKCGGKTRLAPARLPRRCATCGTPKPDSLEAIREATAEGTVVRPDPPAKPAWWDDERANEVLDRCDCFPPDWEDLTNSHRRAWLNLAEAIIEAHFPDRAQLVADVRKAELRNAADEVARLRLQRFRE